MVELRIEGKTIFLRRLTEEDVSDDYVRWMNDPDINQYLECRFYTHTIQNTRDFIRSVTNDNNYQFGIFFKETGCFSNFRTLVLFKQNKRIHYP